MITRASDSSPARLNLLRNSPDFETLPMTDTKDEEGKIESPSTRSEPCSHRVSISSRPSNTVREHHSLANSSSLANSTILANQAVRFRTSCDCSAIVNSNFLYLTSSTTFNRNSPLTNFNNATCKVGDFIALFRAIFDYCSMCVWL